MSKIAANRLNSTWTPLNNEEVNQKIFSERRSLVGKWFDKCNDAQRVAILQELVGQCTGRQLELTSAAVARRKPVVHDDFVRSFPRVLSIYLFSFLDPRSLCRCARVSWRWKSLVEVDQLWINKCLRLGWMLTFTPSQSESGMWKRLYIENILSLKMSSLLQASKTLAAGKSSTDDVGHTSAVRLSTVMSTSSGKRPPWKGSDPAPRDTWRNNYLENEDEVEKVNRLRKRGLYGMEAGEITRRAKNKVNTGLPSSARQRSNSLTRPPSAVPPSLSSSERPAWATSSSSNVLTQAVADIGNTGVTQSNIVNPLNSHQSSSSSKMFAS